MRDIREMTDSGRGAGRTLAHEFGVDDLGLVTVVFADIEGSTALVERVGDIAGIDAINRQLNSVRERIDLVRRSRGEVSRGRSDAHVQFAASGGEFALATQRSLSASAPRVRIGINTGEVIHSSSDPVGGTVNAGARIAACAAGGEVLVSDVVRQLAGIVPAAAFIDRERHRLKGFADPWQLWEATEAAMVRPAPGTVGRIDELAALQGFVASLVSGVGGAVALQGEAGIGKTHLVREVSAMARAAGVHVVEVVADEVVRRAGFVPYGLIADIVSGLSSEIDFASCSEIPPVRRIPAISATRSSSRASTRSSSSPGRTGVVVVEDAQWADDLSLAVLRALPSWSRSTRSAPSSRCDRLPAPGFWID